MRVLILGGTRFIGPYVVRQLAAQGHTIAVYHRGQRRADLPPEVQILPGTIEQLPERRAELAVLAFDVALHMIPVGEKDSQTAMGALIGIVNRVVAVSSIDVYRVYDVLHGKDSRVDNATLTEDSPLREKLYPYRGEKPRPAGDPLRWIDDYDKILAERVIMSQPELPGAIVRLPMVYGPGDYQHRTFHYLKRMDDCRPAILMDEGTARWRGARGYVEDMAHAIALAVTDEHAAGRIYHVADSDSPTETEWIERLASAAGWSGKIAIMPKGRLPAHLRNDFNTAQHWVVNSSRIRAELGYSEIVSSEEALRRTVEWERANPPEKIDPAEYDYASEDAVLADYAPS